MQKQIHVNAYVKRDGTQVKEHFRNIETSTYKPFSINSENFDKAINTKQNFNADEVFPKIGEILKTVVIIGIELAPIAIKIYQKMKANGNSGQNIEYLKPQFDTQIKRFDTQVEQIKYDINNYVKNLVNTKNQKEYLEKYKKLEKLWQTYQQVSSLLNRIKTYAKNSDYKQVATELENFTNDNLNQIVNSMIPRPQALENIYNGMSATVQNAKPEINKLLEVAKYSQGPLYFINNLSNYNRPEAQQFMDLSLNFPKDTYSNSEYLIIQPIFNEKLNEYLRKMGTDLKIPKNMKGIVFDKTSSISQKLSNFEQLQKDIRANYNQNIKFISGLGIDTDTNLQYSVGHFTILNPRIEDGIFKGELFDIYDFEYIPQEYFEKFITYLYNTGAYYLQELHRLKNYYFLIPIEFKW